MRCVEVNFTPGLLPDDPIATGITVNFGEEHSKDDAAGPGTVTVTSTTIAGDCSESSSGSSSVTGVSGSGDSSESTAVTGGLSEGTEVGSNALMTGGATVDDISSIIDSGNAPMPTSASAGSVHEFLENDADLSSDEIDSILLW